MNPNDTEGRLLRKASEITGEVEKDHRSYLREKQKEWDPDRILQEAKYLHFSDWPLPNISI